MARAPEAGKAPPGERGPRTRYRQLKPRPGHSGQRVADHQRARIQGAMIELVAEYGYNRVTVRELVGRAGVSTRAFYQHFTNKEECFLATYDLLIGRAARRIVAAHEGERDWRQRLRLAFGAFAREVAEEPQAARFTLVEAPGAGPESLERLGHTADMFGAMLNECFARAPDEIELPPLLIRGIVAGVAHVARAHVLAGREVELPGLADEMLEWALCLRGEAAMGLRRFDDPYARPPAVESEPAAAVGDGDRPVVGDDRALILSAAARLGASEGYGQLSVPRIRAAAGVSRKSFDAHFDDAKECFLEALELRSGRALADAAHQGAASRTWPGGVHRALAALCTHIARDPVRARAVFVEVFAAGPDGVRCRTRVITNVAEYVAASAPVGLRPSPLATEASVGAVWGILHHQIVAGPTQRLPEIAATLSYLVLAPAIGALAAAEAIRQEQARARSSAAPRGGHSPLSAPSGLRESSVR